MAVKFKEVQFIGLSLCTTPSALNSIEGTSDDGYYAGIVEPDKDIHERISMLVPRIVEAYKSIPENTKTLKIFVIPEFFFRGVLGAYLNKETEDFENIFCECFMKALDSLKNGGLNIGDDWLFILGTFLSTEKDILIETELVRSLYYTGDNLLDVYYRLHSEEKNVMLKNTRTSLHRMLEKLDGKEFMDREPAGNAVTADKEDTSYTDVLKKTLDYCDLKADIPIKNKCFVFSAANADVNMIQKQYKSKEDFVLNTNCDQVLKGPKYLQTITFYPKLNNSTGEEKKGPEDGLSIFEYCGIRIGIEICLDHSRQRLVNHLFKHTRDYVDLQIIPSCGMSIRDNAVIARSGGIVFNCDGEYELFSDSGEPIGTNGIKSHTTLQTVSQEITVDLTSQTVKKNAELKDPEKSIKDIKFTSSTKLFAVDTGNIHIYRPLPLADTQFTAGS